MITPDSAPQVHMKVPSTLPQKVAAAVQVLEFLHTLFPQSKVARP